MRCVFNFLATPSPSPPCVGSGQDDGDAMVPEVLHATFLVDNHVSVRSSRPPKGWLFPAAARCLNGDAFLWQQQSLRLVSGRFSRCRLWNAMAAVAAGGAAVVIAAAAAVLHVVLRLPWCSSLFGRATSHVFPIFLRRACSCFLNARKGKTQHNTTQSMHAEETFPALPWTKPGCCAFVTSFCACVCPSLCLSVSFSFSLPPSLSMCDSLFVSLSLCLCLSIPVPVSVPVSVSALLPLSLYSSLLSSQAADLLVGLVYNLLKLLELHIALLGRGQQQQQQPPAGGYSSPSPLLSPYLGGALLWCLTRWASAYLLPDLHLYDVRRGLSLCLRVETAIL